MSTEDSEDSATVSRVLGTVEDPDSSSPASLMTPNSTPGPGAAGPPQQNHHDQAEGHG